MAFARPALEAFLATPTSSVRAKRAPIKVGISAT
jgi:hypothetical protein